jgi:hypothetical protein
MVPKEFQPAPPRNNEIKRNLFKNRTYNLS